MRISAYESKIKEWMIVYMHAPSGVGIGECRVRCAKSRVGARTLLRLYFIAGASNAYAIRTSPPFLHNIPLRLPKDLC